jgi:uncharacterized protein (DUF1684 family)
MTPVSEPLELADWRRRMAELYAEVRRLASTDPPAAHAYWRAERQRLYREHPQSPVRAGQRTTFRALHFPYDPALRFELPLLRQEPAHVRGDASGSADGGRGTRSAAGAAGPPLPTSIGTPFAFDRIGRVEVPFPDGTRRLSVYWLRGYSGGIFLPFADATSGRETYGSGRYLLDGAKGADLGGDSARGTLVVDFNFAYQPSCAFDPRWSCPLAPPGNHLDVAVRAGERTG